MRAWLGLRYARVSLVGGLPARVGRTCVHSRILPVPRHPAQWLGLCTGSRTHGVNSGPRHLWNNNNNNNDDDHDDDHGGRGNLRHSSLDASNVVVTRVTPSLSINWGRGGGRWSRSPKPRPSQVLVPLGGGASPTWHGRTSYSRYATKTWFEATERGFLQRSIAEIVPRLSCEPRPCVDVVVGASENFHSGAVAIALPPSSLRSIAPFGILTRVDLALTERIFLSDYRPLLFAHLGWGYLAEVFRSLDLWHFEQPLQWD